MRKKKLATVLVALTFALVLAPAASPGGASRALPFRTGVQPLSSRSSSGGITSRAVPPDGPRPRAPRTCRRTAAASIPTVRRCPAPSPIPAAQATTTTDPGTDPGIGV